MEVKVGGTKKEQQRAIRYYDKVSAIYDYISNWYYEKARNYAIRQLKIEKGQAILNLPCGTGVNFKYFQRYLAYTGLIIGVDLSRGMLDKAKRKTVKNGWPNIDLVVEDACKIDQKWLEDLSEQKGPVKIDHIFCDLGLSLMPEWSKIIDNLMAILNERGRIVLLDWYLEKPGLLGPFVKWIGMGVVNRPIWQYLESKVSDFEVATFGLSDGVFVASGTKKE